jgi:hypothetical protein
MYEIVLSSIKRSVNNADLEQQTLASLLSRKSLLSHIKHIAFSFFLWPKPPAENVHNTCDIWKLPTLPPHPLIPYELVKRCITETSMTMISDQCSINFVGNSADHNSCKTNKQTKNKTRCVMKH